jgi:orotidine-5'-phosphate decarboxylase
VTSPPTPPPAEQRGPAGSALRKALIDGAPPLAVIIEPNTEAMSRWGLPDTLESLSPYVETLAASMSGLAILAKIQMAAFERFGPRGLVELIAAVQALRDAGMLVVLDTKRTDHAPVLRELVGTFVGPTSWYGSDGFSVLPYLGMSEIVAAAPGCADALGLLLVIAQTSNVDAWRVQQARSEGAGTVAASVVEAVSSHNLSAGRDELAVVLGGAPEMCASLIEGLSGLAILPGWGRPTVNRRALKAIQRRHSDRVIISMGSFLTATGPAVADVRRALQAQWTEIMA